MSVSGSGPETSSATRSSACLESAASAAMRRSSRARSDAVTVPSMRLRSEWPDDEHDEQGADDDGHAGRRDDQGREAARALGLDRVDDAARTRCGC